eukprot:227570-Chlamydomonas_euryale.AAC.1
MGARAHGPVQGRPGARRGRRLCGAARDGPPAAARRLCRHGERRRGPQAAPAVWPHAGRAAAGQAVQRRGGEAAGAARLAHAGLRRRDLHA